jgi:hypothetical protein
MFYKYYVTRLFFKTTCKILEPYDNPFGEKSNRGGKKKEEIITPY